MVCSVSSKLPLGSRRRTPKRSNRLAAGALGLELSNVIFSIRRIRESSSEESPVTHGTTLTCTEAVSVYSPMVATAVIVPDFEMVRVQVSSFHPQTALIPPVPLSGVHCQFRSRVHDIAGEGVTVAVKVTDCGPTMLCGDAEPCASGQGSIKFGTVCGTVWKRDEALRRKLLLHNRAPVAQVDRAAAF